MVKERVSSLDRSDWATVYEAHAVRLTRLAVVLVGPSDCHDLVADAVMRAVGAPGWSEVEFKGAYLARTVVHLAEDRRRQTGRRQQRELRVGAMRRNAADNSLVDVERALVVRAALSTLSTSQLAVVFLHYWEDLTLEQTATQLGLGVGTARTHLARAKRRLRSVLPLDQGEST
jgi:RNA polymerase sigma factor (sigma-70 family)